MSYPSKLEELANMAEDHGPLVAKLSERVLLDPKFATWSGSGKKFQHHYGTGGLQHHTWEVVTLTREISKFYMSTHPDLLVQARELFLAALFHDIGKTEDYQKDPLKKVQPAGAFEYQEEWVKAPHSRDIHHISRSALIYNEAAAPFTSPTVLHFGNVLEGLDKPFNDRVLHCILSHHGMREWGSPVMPHSRIAWLLHLADSMSARMDDADKWDFTK